MRRLLADVGPTRVDAKAFDVARRPVRHVAPPPHQDCRPRRRDEDHDPGALANLMPRSGYPTLRWTHTAPRHMTDGHEAPNIHPRPFNPQTLIPQTRFRPEPTSRGQTYAKFKKITPTQRSRARTRQSAALSASGDVGVAAGSEFNPKSGSRDQARRRIQLLDIRHPCVDFQLCDVEAQPANHRR